MPNPVCWRQSLKDRSGGASILPKVAPPNQLEPKPHSHHILLGSLASRTGMSVKRNAATMEITGDPAAVKLINPEARKGWPPKASRELRRK